VGPNLRVPSLQDKKKKKKKKTNFILFFQEPPGAGPPLGIAIIEAQLLMKALDNQVSFVTFD
jgi:hypothetical protein